jgi:hypothetical protein
VGLLLTTRDTVAMETPAALATSTIVTLFPICQFPTSGTSGIVSPQEHSR